MEMIVHIGTPKTGTTALQSALSSMREQLLQHGVLYPRAYLNSTNHNFLSLFARNGTSMPRVFYSRFKNRLGKLWKLLEEDYALIEDQIRKHQPEIIILSGENMFPAAMAEQPEQLKAKLKNLCKLMRVVTYVRRPSEKYLSAVQQKIRHSSVFPAPTPAKFRRPLEAWASLLETRPEVAIYHRNSLLGGDIVRDFMKRFVRVDLLADYFTDSVIKNESLSAESIELLQEFRSINFPDKDDLVLPESNLLRRTIQRVETAMGNVQRPKLLEGIADYIDYGSEDLVWLDKEYGLRFADIDYSKIKAHDCNPYEHGKKIFEICNVNQDVKREITMRVINMLASTQIRRKDG